MPCYHPLPAWKGLGPSGDPQVAFGVAPPKGLTKFSTLEIPCGRCIGCRLDKSRQWAMRCVYEASLYEENSFVTLTYSPVHLPLDGSLVPFHLTDFFKRLRRRIEPRKVRFYACGEYGSLTRRPHYHAILFGYLPDDIESEEVKSVDGTAKTIRHSKFLDDVWGFGHVSVGSVTFESCAYVARYFLKKVTGSAAAAHYGERVPEFSRMSRRPGIASVWFDRFRSDVTNTDTCLSRGHPCKPPRFFDKCLERLDAVLYERIKAQRELDRPLCVDWRELERVEGVKLETLPDAHSYSRDF